MKIVKLVPFYLFLSYNVLLSFLYLITYPEEMVSDQMPWNAEALGWRYANRINYTIATLIELIILIVPSVYAWRKRKESFLKASVVMAIPFFSYLVRGIYMKLFFNI